MWLSQGPCLGAGWVFTANAVQGILMSYASTEKRQVRNSKLSIKNKTTAEW